MIVYNVTVKVSADIIDSWIEWQKTEHIPEIMATGLFAAYKFFRLLEQDDSEGPTFVIQYFASSLEKYQEYINTRAQVTREHAIQKWGNKFVAFRTVMETVD